MRNIITGPLWADVRDPEIEALLHPGWAFDHPEEVVNDPDLTLHEKRAILSSWASDACAVDSQPSLRMAPGSKGPVNFDDVVEALRSLDSRPQPRWKRTL